MPSKKKRSRGRPPGRSRRGELSREHLHRTALALIAERGYEATTLRGIAAAAGVSPGLLYRYFESKQAIVMALYDELSLEYAERAAGFAASATSAEGAGEGTGTGSWGDGFMYALRTSLEVLGPQREILVELVPLLVGDRAQGVLAYSTSFARERVQQVFLDLVAHARDAPGAELVEPLGRLLYLWHLLVILWWLLDQSPEQRATSALVESIAGALPMASLALGLPQAQSLVATAHALITDAFFQADRG